MKLLGDILHVGVSGYRQNSKRADVPFNEDYVRIVCSWLTVEGIKRNHTDLSCLEVSTFFDTDLLQWRWNIMHWVQVLFLRTLCYEQIFTARIQRMREGNSFALCVIHDCFFLHDTGTLCSFTLNERERESDIGLWWVLWKFDVLFILRKRLSASSFAACKFTLSVLLKFWLHSRSFDMFEAPFSIN